MYSQVIDSPLFFEVRLMSSVMTNDEWANQGPEKPRGFVVKEAMMQQHYTERKTHVLKCSCRAAAIHKSSVLLV